MTIPTRWRARHDATFDDRFVLLSSLAFRVAHRIVVDRADAQDVAQETMARAYARWSRVADHDEAWVSRVAANLAIGVWRKRRRPPPAPAEAAPGLDTAVVARLALADALAALPRRQREVVVLRYLADRSESAVALQLGLSAGTVKQHAHRAMRALRVALGPDELLEVDRAATP